MRRRHDSRPLWVLVWGGIDDVAQALHDAPDILPKLRVYFIGGPNKMWSVDAYDDIERNHPSLWVVEFALPIPAGMTRAHLARMIFDNRVPAVGVNDGRALRFRFSPRDAKVWSYVIRSDYAPLDGMEGRFTAVPPSPEQTRRPSLVHPHWWTDDQDPSVAEGIHRGARSVNRWRREFLQDFALRAERCRTPKTSR